MPFYLSSALANTRKGRFLHTVVGAIPLTSDWKTEPPEGGLMLVKSEELTDKDACLSLYHWAMRAGCGVLLVNPQEAQLALLAQLPMPLDWQLSPVSASASGAGVTALLASEIDYAILGVSGGADRRHHQAGDVVHTRYLRKHSNSGLLAVTTLPLWSLSLIDHGEVLEDWLNWFVEHAGVLGAACKPKTAHVDYMPGEHDLAVMLLLHAGHGMSLKALAKHNAVLQMFDIHDLDMTKRSDLLQQHGFIDKTGLTELGLRSLKASPYWVYLTLLRDQLHTGAPQV